MIKRIKGLFLFLFEFLRKPSHVGALWPSSRWLAKSLAKQIPANPNGIILDLGAGTGVVTRALIAKGFKPEQIIIVEQSPQLAAHLRMDFPASTVIQGQAQQLHELLGDKAVNIHAIVSSLPLRSIETSQVQLIVQELQQLLPKQALLIQFTYDWFRPYHIIPDHFQLKYTKSIWLNFPPARIGVFKQYD